MIAAIYARKSQGGSRRMTKDEAIGFHGDMEALFARGPGGIDDEARHQLQPSLSGRPSSGSMGADAEEIRDVQLRMGRVWR
jgi:hypothetical protein